MEAGLKNRRDYDWRDVFWIPRYPLTENAFGRRKQGLEVNLKLSSSP